MLNAVWPLPLSLATTRGISVDFSSSAYLDVSVRRVPRVHLFYSMHDVRFFTVRVSPFGNPRIDGYVLLPVAYRSLSRPSSAPDAKAFPLCSSSLELLLCVLSDSHLGSLCLNCCNHIHSYFWQNCFFPNFTERPLCSLLTALSFNFTLYLFVFFLLYSVFNELSLRRSGLTRFRGVRLDLSSRAVARQVLSALCSLTSVFGMGTGVPCTLKRRTILF